MRSLGAEQVKARFSARQTHEQESKETRASNGNNNLAFGCPMNFNGMKQPAYSPIAPPRISFAILPKISHTLLALGRNLLSRLWRFSRKSPREDGQSPRRHSHCSGANSA